MNQLLPVLLALCLTVLGMTSENVQAQVFKTQDEFLQETFATSDTVMRKTIFLTRAERESLEEMARSRFESRIITYYEAIEGDSVLGYAYFETEIVRSKPATFVIVINPDATVRVVEMLAFYEPIDYLPTLNWFRLFVGMILDNELWPRRAIDNVTGATLTVQAVTAGVRRSLALHQLITTGR